MLSETWPRRKYASIWVERRNSVEATYKACVICRLQVAIMITLILQILPFERTCSFRSLIVVEVAVGSTGWHASSQYIGTMGGSG